jgi:hypothetical protein
MIAGPAARAWHSLCVSVAPCETNLRVLRIFVVTLFGFDRLALRSWAPSQVARHGNRLAATFGMPRQGRTAGCPPWVSLALQATAYPGLSKVVPSGQSHIQPRLLHPVPGTAGIPAGSRYSYPRPSAYIRGAKIFPASRRAPRLLAFSALFAVIYPSLQTLNPEPQVYAPFYLSHSHWHPP